VQFNLILNMPISLVKECFCAQYSVVFGTLGSSWTIQRQEATFGLESSGMKKVKASIRELLMELNTFNASFI
jgi:hypothetical protein